MFGPASEMLGVDVEKDLLARLGDALTVWSSPSRSGGLLLNGLTFAVTLKDAKAFRAPFGVAMSKLAELAPRKTDGVSRWVQRGAYLERIDDHATPIWFLNCVGLESIVAPAWCVTDSHLLVGMFPQALVDVLEDGPPADSLASDSAFAEHVGDEEGTLAAGLFDLGAGFETIYPALQMLASYVLSEIQHEGFELDMRSFPRYRTVARHLGREYMRVDVSRRGVTLTRRGTLPMSDPLFALAAPLLGLRYFLMDMGRAVAAERAVAVAPRVVVEPAPPAPRPAPALQAEMDAAVLHHAARAYLEKHGEVPTLESLKAPDDPAVAPILRGAMKDPWGNTYVIRETPDGGLEVRSLGPDGRSGTADDVTVSG
jgi:hypothetical protein